MATKCPHCLTLEYQNPARVEGPAQKGKAREGQDIVLSGNIWGLLGRLKVLLLFSPTITFILQWLAVNGPCRSALCNKLISWIKLVEFSALERGKGEDVGNSP